MQVSVEIRWFKEGPVPDQVSTWFEASPLPIGSSSRDDVYALATAELGVKKRGIKPGVELKTLVWTDSDSRGLPLEQWVKTSWDGLDLSRLSTVTVQKRRQLRKFGYADGVVAEVGMKPGSEDTADGSTVPVGCNVELTTLSVQGSTWSTVGFEAFGALHTLRDVVAKTLETTQLVRADWLTGWQLQSYPAWLQQFAT